MKKPIKLNPKQQAEFAEKHKETLQIIELGKKLNEGIFRAVGEKAQPKLNGKCVFDGTNQTGNFIGGMALMLFCGFTSEPKKIKKNERKTV